MAEAQNVQTKFRKESTTAGREAEHLSPSVRDISSNESEGVQTDSQISTYPLPPLMKRTLHQLCQLLLAPQGVYRK